MILVNKIGVYNFTMIILNRKKKRIYINSNNKCEQLDKSIFSIK